MDSEETTYETRRRHHIVFMLPVIFLDGGLRADWSSAWKATVAAAKKEGRLNNLGRR